MADESRSVGQLSQLFERVRQMPVGGDLESLLVDELADLRRLVIEESLAAREATLCSSKESFPPSGVSELRPRPDGVGGAQGPPGEDAWG